MTEIAVGQIWADNDPRSAGRTLKVLAVSNTSVLCEVVTDGPHTVISRVGKTTRIKPSRFRANASGYRLLEDV